MNAPEQGASMSRNRLAAVCLLAIVGAVSADVQAQSRTSRAVIAAQAEAARAQAARYGQKAQSVEAPAADDTLGRPNPGRPQFQDPEFRGVQPSAKASNGAQTSGAQAAGKSDGEGEDVLEIAEGFFFDNFTSGSGFGVYGGEAVTSGPGQQLNLPSAGVNARNLGLPIVPNQQPGIGQPIGPGEPPID